MKKYEPDSDLDESLGFEDEEEREDLAVKGGGAMDHYDDDRSRKAVGRLFESRDIDVDVEPPEKDKEPPAVREDDGYVMGFDKPKRAKESHEDYEVRFDMYRRKERTEKPERPSAPAQPRPAVVTGGRPIKSKIPVRKASDIDDDIDDIDEYDNQDYEQFRERYKGREYIPSAKYGTVDKPPSGSPRPVRRQSPAPAYADIDDADDYYGGEVSSTAKITVGIICFIFLCTLALLVFRLNGVSSELKEAQARLLVTNDTEFEEMKINNEALKNDNDAMAKEIADLKSQLSTYTDGSEDSNNDDNPDTTPPSNSNTDAPKSSEETTYKVVSGDSLAKISKKFYGTESHVDKIKQANNLTSDNILVDMVLTIPKLD